ncbi:hypothetical protein AC579_4671 [Pseudocercospora musae]|uniref:Uncharacterized protein n=1 Tax=Pseudocercospora musae TaxID=113226 RepID=A0A139I2D2_9PEZI|nr:hypothetical protein AC579_4671 [Pseudocercospora musae]
MTFNFFHLPREVRDRIYHNLRITGSCPVKRHEHDGDETVKAAIDVKPCTSHLLVSKWFKTEYVVIVFSGATFSIGSAFIHQQKAPVLPSLIIENVNICKINLFIPYDAHKVQEEAQLNTICDQDVFLDLPFEEGERIGNFLCFDDDQYDEGEDHEELSDSEIEWKHAAEELASWDGEEELDDLDEHQNTLAPDWLLSLLFEFRALESIELVVTSGEPMPASQADGPADSLQLIAAEMKDLLRVPFLSKLEARRIFIQDYGFHDTKFAGVTRCGIWTAECGWKTSEEVGVVREGELELPVNECPGWKCGDSTCLGARNKHPASASNRAPTIYAVSEEVVQDIPGGGEGDGQDIRMERVCISRGRQRCK